MKTVFLLAFSTGAYAQLITINDPLPIMKPANTTNCTINAWGTYFETKMFSKTMESAISIEWSDDCQTKKLVMENYYIGTFVSLHNGVNSYGADSYGRFQVNSDFGSYFYGPKLAADKYLLSFDDQKEGLLVIRNSKGAKVWDSGISTFPADCSYCLTSGKTTANIKESFGPWQSSSFIYIMDSFKLDPGMVYTIPNHFGTIVQSLKVLSQGLNVQLEQLTTDSSGGTETFNETSFITSLQKIFNYPETRTKIINFSAVFDDPSSLSINCAIQWAHNAGIYFIAAAGNENKKINFYNPFQLVTGGVQFSDNFTCASPKANSVQTWSNSNYGSFVDIWAGKQLNFLFEEGTSFGNALTTAATASAISKWSLLAKNPASGYRYLKDISRTDLMLNDPKVKVSPNALNRILSVQKITATPKSYAAPSADFCKSLKLPTRNPTPGDWASLLKKVNSSNKAHFVGTFSVGGTQTSPFKR